MKQIKNLILTAILMIVSITTSNAQMTACKGINDSIEIHGGVGPYTWVVDSLHYYWQPIDNCNTLMSAITNNQILPVSTTSIIYYIGNNTIIKPNKIISGDIYNFGSSFTACSTIGLNITNVYPIRIYDSNGDSLILNSASDLQYPTATITSIDESSSLFCDGSSVAQLSNGIASINWLNSDSTILSTVDSVTNLCVGTYTLNLIDTIGCKNSYITTILAGPIPSTQPICLITVDQTNTHNLLVWDKTNLESAVDSIIIYREITTDNYQRIGAQHKDSLSAFDDYLANPNVGRNFTDAQHKLTIFETYI